MVSSCALGAIERLDPRLLINAQLGAWSPRLHHRPLGFEACGTKSLFEELVINHDIGVHAVAA